MNEISMSSRLIEAQHQPSVSRDNKDRDLTFFKARTLHFMSISITASRDNLQRMSIVSNNHSRAFVSSSKQSDQRELRSLDIQSLFNSIEDENHSNESSAVDSLNLSKLSIDLSISSRFHVHNLLSTKSSSYRQVNQKTFYSQTQNREAFTRCQF